VENKTKYISVADGEMYIDGTNLHLRNGQGATDTVNGLGNLIIGYNAPQGPFEPGSRSGSHNLVVGEYHKYASYGGIVAGYSNEIRARYACVSGGAYNKSTVDYASVSGGRENTAADLAASVSGGRNNKASEDYASVSGGYFNFAQGEAASVS